MRPELDPIATAGLPRRRHAPRLLIGLGVALLLGGCVSARPWRDCFRPCRGDQLKKAEEVQVFRLDGTVARFDWVRWEEDGTGPYLVGGQVDRRGVRSKGERVESGEICAVRTRRVEFGRVVANFVLVPLAVVGTAGLVVLDAKDGEQEYEPGWELPGEAPPPELCTWLRREALAAPG